MNSGLLDGLIVFEGIYERELLETLKINSIPSILVGENLMKEYDFVTYLQTITVEQIKPLNI